MSQPPGVCTAQFSLVHGAHSSLPLEYEVQEPSDFQTCGICGRTFNPDVLVRLEVTCIQAFIY